MIGNLKIWKIFRNTKGNVMIWCPVVVIVMLLIGTSVFEYQRLTVIAQGSRDAVQTAITQVCTEQYDQLYNGLREGYSGGYKLQSTSWTENVDVINITTKLDAKLGTHNGEKNANGKTEYKITGMSVQLHNAPLAPGNPDDTKQFSGTAAYTLTVPLSFGWQSLPPMVIPMEVTAGYSPQGELAAGGGDGSGGDGIPVTGIELSESALTLQKGEYASLSAEVSPDDATDPDVKWTSANDGVATVNRAGLVKGMDAGTTKVLAMSDGRMAQCDVTVVNPVTHVALNKTSLKLNKGASETLVAAVAPDNATDKSLWWTTSSADICTIDANGKVTAINPGTAEIAVEARSGGKMATCQVTVESPVSGVTLNKTAMTLRPGASEKLTATVTPEDATNPGVMWASSNPEICTVDQDGNVTAVRAGTAVISATAKDNIHMAQCTVTVTIPVTGVTLNKTYLSIIKGASDILYATVWPADATNKTITWSSSNSAVCSVDQSGVITGTGVGTATITVTTQDGGFTAACTVDVKPNTYVVSANAVHGHVEGTGTYWAGMNVTLTAVPDHNYEFVNWTNSSGAVIGTDTTYTIYNLSADTTSTANFKKMSYQWTYAISSTQCSISDSSNKSSMNAYFYSLSERAYQRYGQVAYTFTKPVVLPAGSGIAVTIDWGYDFSFPCSVAVNGSNITSSNISHGYGSETNLMYRYPSGITLNTITVRSEFGKKKSGDGAVITVRVVPLNGDPFIMNFTGTSENQYLPESYIANQDTSKKYDYAIIRNSTQIYFADVKSDYYQYGTSQQIDFHYYQPLDVDRVVIEAFPKKSYSSCYFSLYMMDVYNNVKEFSTRWNNGSKWIYGTILSRDIIDSNGNIKISLPANSPARGWMTGGTDGNGNTNGPKDLYVYDTGFLNTDKVCDFSLKWGAMKDTYAVITVYLKDGTSFNIIQGHK